jgi:hypothetical protein
MRTAEYTVTIEIEDETTDEQMREQISNVLNDRLSPAVVELNGE